MVAIERHLSRSVIEDNGVFVIRMQQYTENIQDIWVLHNDGEGLELNHSGTRSGSWAVSEDGLAIEILTNPEPDGQWGVGVEHIEVRLS